MNLTLNNTGTTGSENVSHQIIEDINKQIEVLNSRTTSLESDVESLEESVEGNYNELNGRIDGLVRQTDRMESSIDDALADIASLKGTINSDTLSKSHIDANLLESDTSSLGEASADNLSVVGDITADTITTNEIKSNGNVKCARLETEAFALGSTLSVSNANINNLNTTRVISDAVNTNLLMTDAINMGVDIYHTTILLSGWTNGYLHKMQVRADGILVIKMPDAAIVVEPGSISSNYNKLYAAYLNDGVWDIYIDGNVDCNAFVIGQVSVTSSLVLKSSVRRNADSNGQPNDTNEVKVAVVSGLPSIGRRNVIYIVLGDCAYYCDGVYFYEMASKKRG